jgi:hypothetical protein
VPLKRAIITEQPIVGPADPAMPPPPIGGDIRRRVINAAAAGSDGEKSRYLVDTPSGYRLVR